MDFEYHYSDEQQRFRDEVRSWLDANVPPGHEMPVDPEDLDEETYRFFRSVHQELGARGWLYPTYPREYGGGGLTPEHEMILLEELDRRKIPGVSGGGLFSNNLVLPSILVWGTAEQKERFLPGLLTGKTIAFQTFTEPNAGSDLAALQSRAVRDGDDWIITGQKVFISGMGVPDLLYGPFVSDPDAPRHENLGYFLIPNPSPGLTVEKMALLNGSNQHFIYFDEVRVSGGNLIGGDHDGWQVALTTLEQEHGGRGLAFYRDEGLAELQRYVQDTRRHDRPMGSDPLVQADVVQSYLDSQVHRLLELRNYSMYTGRTEMTYHGSQAALWRKEFRQRNADRERSVLGPYALLDRRDPAGLFQGAPEFRQRWSLTQAHPGGTIEIQKIIVARRLGVSRTRERAARTPATATAHGS